jgi:hypothetical protein
MKLQRLNRSQVSAPVGCPHPVRPKRASQTAAEGFAPAVTPTNNNQKKKRTSEVGKGTFLKKFDNRRMPA